MDKIFSMSFVCYKHNNKSTTTNEIPVCSDIVRDLLLVLEANIVKKIKKTNTRNQA